MTSSSLFLFNERIGKSPSVTAFANSKMALDFEAEHPALRSWVGDSPAIRIGSIRPPDNWATLLVIVAAALTESCCPRIDSAKDWKFETLEV
jgi:hypothetical protein